MVETLHIMHIIDSLAVGGAERMLVELANATRKSNYKVSVCVTRSVTSLADRLQPEIPTFVLGRTSRFDLRGFQKLGGVLKQEKVDIIHCHGKSTFSFLAIASYLGVIRAPILLHDHDGWIEVNHTMPYWFRILGHKKAAYFVGVHEQLVKSARAAGVALGRSDVIDNAIDLSNYQRPKNNRLRETLKLGPDALIGVFIGGIRRQKGLIMLLDALHEISTDKDWRMIIVGKVQEEDYWQGCLERIERYGLRGKVIYLGPSNDVADILAGANFGVIPSISESGPLVLIEFLASGLPFAATLTGSVSRKAYEAGLLGFVPPNDAPRFASEINKIINLSDSEREDRGSRGTTLAKECFDMKKQIQFWYPIYTKIMRRK